MKVNPLATNNTQPQTVNKLKIIKKILGLGSLLILTSCSYLPHNQSKATPPNKTKLVPVPVEKTAVGERTNVLVVPTIAITEENNTKGVLVGAPNQPPKFVPVTTGSSTNNRTEVTSGLNGTEHILIEASQVPANLRKEGMGNR